MRCPLCNFDNPAGYQFCGNCGQAREQSAFDPGSSLAAGQSSPVRADPANPTDTVWPAAPSSRISDLIPAQGPSPEASRPGRPSDAEEMTRYLCAAVTMDKALTNQLIENVLEEEHRAVAVTPGLDLVTVLKFAIAANRRRMIRDVVLFLTLCLLIVAVFSLIGLLLVIPLLIAAWLAVFIEKYTSLYGRSARGLRPGAFDSSQAPEPGQGTFAARQLDRVAEAAGEGNVTVYSAFPPFLGYGRIRASWSIAADVTKPRGDSRPRPFNVLDLYDHVKREIARLDLPRLQMSDRVYVNGSEIWNDGRFLPDPRGVPVTFVDEETVRQLIAFPEEHARPYLTMSLTGWHGDIVVTTLLRLVLTQTDLFVEAAHMVVPPLRMSFKEIDELEPSPSGSEFFSMVRDSSVETIPRLLGSIRSIGHALGTEGRREKKARRVRLSREYGALVSVRERAADTHWQRYFQQVDDTHYASVVEHRIMRSLTEFLKSHEIDTSSFERQSDAVINNGVMISGHATVQAGGIAAGAEAQATGNLFTRMRGGGGGEASSSPSGGTP
jgi:hypothetical protein